MTLGKERAQRLHSGLIKGSEKAGKRSSMRQLRSAKEGHTWGGERKESLIKGLDGWFSAHSVAHEHHDKINHLCEREQTALAPQWLSAGHSGRVYEPEPPLLLATG